MNYSFLFTFLLFSLSIKAQQTKAYFQQKVDYTIQVELNDKEHMLRGNESFVYTNNSPDALEFIYIHLWPNAYKNQRSALAKQLAREKNFILFYAMEKSKGFIDSLDFSVDNQKARWEFDPLHEDIAILYLSKPLQPGTSITVSTPFRVKIPSGSISRLGHIGESYQITQWYPKPAVYDRNGWHQMPYLNQGEFYSEFGSFDVSITLPSNYVVGATGDLQNQEEIDFMNALADKGLNRPDLDSTNAFPSSSTTTKTLRYLQSNVHDFGWFADKRWMVLKGEVSLPNSGRNVTSWALFTPESKDVWNRAIEFINDATFYYSKWNGDYPYNQVTAVDGTISAGGGMEYPNVTVIGSTSSYRSLEVVIMHEVGHNWFYGILGSNERDNAWMDEGINSFNEDRYMDTKYPDARLTEAIGMMRIGPKLGMNKYNQRVVSEFSYLFNARRELDQQLHCSSEKFTSLNYGGMVYKKTALVFYYLKSVLGEAAFDKAMQAYFEKWKFKHPEPQDLKESLEASTGKDLSWFFNGLVNDNGKINFAIANVKKSDKAITVKVKNRGDVAGPIVLALQAKDGKWVESVTSDVIQPGQEALLSLKNQPDAQTVAIDPYDQMPDINRIDNQIRVNGPFKKVEKVAIRPLGGLENSKRTQMYVMPLVAWNNYDKWMVGATLNNRAFPFPAWSWAISPLYSISSNQLNGFVQFSHKKKRRTIGLNGQKFSFANGSDVFNGQVREFEVKYARINPYVEFDWSPRNENLTKGVKHNLRLDFIQLIQLVDGTISNIDAPLTPQSFSNSSGNFFTQVSYEYSKKINYRNKLSTRLIAQLPGILEVNNFGVFDPIASGEIRFSHIYNNKHKRTIEARVFAAQDFGTGNNFWSLSGQTGLNDFTFQNLYLGRTEQEGILSRQLIQGHGMLRNPTEINGFETMLAANVDVFLPFKLPFGFYGNWAVAGNRNVRTPGRSFQQFATAGVVLRLLKDKAEVYCTLWRSSLLEEERKSLDWNRVQLTFVLDIAAFNAWELLRSAEP
jgi:hypothetical protein